MVRRRRGHDRRQGDVLVGDDRKRSDGQRAIEFQGLVAEVENIPALLKQRRYVKDTIHWGTLVRVPLGKVGYFNGTVYIDLYVKQVYMMVLIWKRPEETTNLFTN